MYFLLLGLWTKVIWSSVELLIQIYLKDESKVDNLIIIIVKKDNFVYDLITIRRMKENMRKKTVKGRGVRGVWERRIHKEDKWRMKEK